MSLSGQDRCGKYTCGGQLFRFGRVGHPSRIDRLFVSRRTRRKGREGEMKLEVDCYSGRTADERPVRFRLDGLSVHGRGGAGPVVRPARCLLQSTRRRRQSLHPAPGNVDARWTLASGVVPATATPELIWEVDRRQPLPIRPLRLMDPAPSIFLRQHERHHGLAVIARPRDRFQRYEPHPLWPTPGGRVDRLV